MKKGIVNLKNTKTEILDAYEDAVKRLSEKTVPVADNQNSKNIVDKASSQDSKDIIGKIADIKIEVTNSLEVLCKKLLSEHEKLSELQNAISCEEKKLKEVHDIAYHVNGLEALIITHSQEEGRVRRRNIISKIYS